MKVGDIIEFNNKKFWEKKLMRRFDEGMAEFTRFRILQVDEVETFIDYQIEFRGVQKFGSETFGKGANYFGRKSKRLLADYGVLIGFDEITTAHQNFLHNNLPFRISRCKNFDWSSTIFENIEELEANFSAGQIGVWQNKKLFASNIYIEAQTVSGGLKAPFLLQSDNGLYFTALELLQKAYYIQKKVTKGKKIECGLQGIGVGIYRGGVKQGLPLYYIGGYYDRAGILALEESLGTDISSY